MLFSLQQHAEAQRLNTEGLQIAEEIEEHEYIFKGKILSAKIDFDLGKKEVSHDLEEMLQQPQNNGEIAALHYELWQMTRNDSHRQAGYTLYQTLHSITPKIEYKTRMEELKQ